MPELAQPGGWLPLAFGFLMGLSMLIYVVLDGYDLGVGILMRGASDEHRDLMVASIGPFWDANETWLVLGVGILLTAFPVAHGIVLGELYLPVALMLGGLTLRGVAFDFRVKARDKHKAAWNRAFHIGSLVAAVSQGAMLGRYITGFTPGWWGWAFALFVGACVAAGYALLGAGWLLIKTEGALQLRAVRWARHSLLLTAAGIVAISVASPLVSPRIMEKWFSMPNLLWLSPVPLLTGVLLVWIARTLHRLPADGDRRAWVPFAGSVGVFVLSFAGLAFSLLPYLVVDRLTLWEAAAAPESLMVIFVGAVVVLPMILGYTAYSYWVFRGKAVALKYS